MYQLSGQTLASGSYQEIWLWDLSQPGSEPRVLEGHEAFVLSVSFSPDGKMLALESSDTTVRIWATLEFLVELSCERTRGNFTWGEWQEYLPAFPYEQTCPNLPVHPSVPVDQWP